MKCKQFLAVLSTRLAAQTCPALPLSHATSTGCSRSVPSLQRWKRFDRPPGIHSTDHSQVQVQPLPLCFHCNPQWRGLSSLYVCTQGITRGSPWRLESIGQTTADLDVPSGSWMALDWVTSFAFTRRVALASCVCELRWRVAPASCVGEFRRRVSSASCDASSVGELQWEFATLSTSGLRSGPCAWGATYSLLTAVYTIKQCKY